MSKRLQVVLADEDLARYERAAKAAGLTLSEWVRQALGQVERTTSTGDVDRKVRAVREALHYHFPAPEIDQLLREIEGGSLGQTERS